MKKFIAAMLVLALNVTQAYAYTLNTDGAVLGVDGDMGILIYEVGADGPGLASGDVYLKTDDTYGVLVDPAFASSYWGYEISQNNGEMTIAHQNRTITVPFDGDTAVIDGTQTNVVHVMLDGKMFFPYTELETLFGAEASWDGAKKLLTLVEKENIPLSDAIQEYRDEILRAPFDENARFKDMVVTNDGSKIKVSIDGNEVAFTDAEPFIDDNDRTQMPVRAVTEALGATVGWDDKTKTVTVSGNDVDMSLKIGSDVMTLNGAEVKMDTAAVIVNDRTYVPIRFIAEAMGMTVLWK